MLTRVVTGGWDTLSPPAEKTKVFFVTRSIVLRKLLDSLIRIVARL
jgi:hypothetical protein